MSTPRLLLSNLCLDFGCSDVAVDDDVKAAAEAKSSEKWLAAAEGSSTGFNLVALPSAGSGRSWRFDKSTHKHTGVSATASPDKSDYRRHTSIFSVN